MTRNSLCSSRMSRAKYLKFKNNKKKNNLNSGSMA